MSARLAILQDGLAEVLENRRENCIFAVCYDCLVHLLWGFENRVNLFENELKIELKLPPELLVQKHLPLLPGLLDLRLVLRPQSLGALLLLGELILQGSKVLFISKAVLVVLFFGLFEVYLQGAHLLLCHCHQLQGNVLQLLTRLPRLQVVLQIAEYESDLLHFVY